MPENTRSSELREEIEFRLEMADSKPTPEAINSIEDLIASKVEEARIDELKRMHPHINRNLGNYHAYKDRLKELEALQSKEGRNEDTTKSSS